MNNSNYATNGARSHGFLNLNGYPYLSGEYLDISQFQTVDRSLIRNQLLIENTNPQTNVVDIVIDNVGDTPTGNRSSYERFLDSLAKAQPGLRGYLDTVRPGLRVDIDYHLESERTGNLIRVATATLFVKNIAHYLELNGAVNDGSSVLTNFTDSVVKTIANRTYGSDRLVIRLTKVRLSYVGLKRQGPNQYDDRPRRDLNEADIFRPDLQFDRYDPRYHEINQPQFSFDQSNLVENGYRQPPPWAHSRYYHFVDQGRAIDLHLGEINSHSAPTFQIPVGSIELNKAFVTNGTFRILFRVSVWKNDTIVLNNTRRVAEIIGANGPANHYDPHCGDHHYHHHHGGGQSGDGSDQDLTEVMELIDAERVRNDTQDVEIQDLKEMVEAIDLGGGTGELGMTAKEATDLANGIITAYAFVG